MYNQFMVEKTKGILASGKNSCFGGLYPTDLIIVRFFLIET